MKLTVDTNVLIRAVVGDDERQSRVAIELLREAEVIVIPLLVLAEFVWVLKRLYGFGPTDILDALRGIASAQNVIMDRPAFEAGLAHFEAGGDFADGVIAFEGMKLGAEIFATFDQTAASLLKASGVVVKAL